MFKYRYLLFCWHMIFSDEIHYIGTAMHCSHCGSEELIVNAMVNY
jgi:hypothetical protein